MKSILITGASSGIGAATARDFLAEGWQVGLLARREDALIEVAGGHQNAVILPADVSDADAVDAAAARFVQNAGRIDVLFNNAGLFGPAAEIDAVDVAEWMQVLQVNLTGMFLCARAAYAIMRKQDPKGGRIINNGSISAHVPRENSVCYTTTKHAITGLTKSLSLDGRAHNIACGQIDIGNARTELLDGIIEGNRAKDLPEPPTMDVSEAVRAVRLMAGMPLEANVQFMTVMATAMPYIGRG
ncbi:SDR family oxidoreductase [Roseivivax halotolerans]|uniref:SDR family oxidoreductase n=1 Tax=Roseivivax halotolerans TaxID=93684 RepID=UPI000B85E302|nr:SDR family oxidoreductase [Roseivivax halotolerans]